MASTTKKEGSDSARRSDAQEVSARLSVREDEDAWSPEELDEVRQTLQDEVERLSAEVEEAEQELAQLMRSYGDGAGDDQADAGAATLEREQELSLAQNSRELLGQTTHALERIAAGSYGDCESCGEPIGKMRLQAFPRATLCMTCKQKQERR